MRKPIILYVIFILALNTTLGQTKKIDTDKLWNVFNGELFRLNGDSVPMLGTITLESVNFPLLIKSVKLIDNTFLEITGHACVSHSEGGCIPMEFLGIFTGKRKGNYLIDTLNLYHKELHYDHSLNQDFTVKLNIRKTDCLYLYSTDRDFLLYEFNIIKLKKLLLGEDKS